MPVLPRPVHACGALECGSLLPLSRLRARSRGPRRCVLFAASKLAGEKAAASCRTLKLRSACREVTLCTMVSPAARVSSQRRRSARYLDTFLSSIARTRSKNRRLESQFARNSETCYHPDITVFDARQ